MAAFSRSDDAISAKEKLSRLTVLKNVEAGLKAIHASGGMTVVQDPNEANFPYMPLNALQQNCIDYRLTIAETQRSSISPP